MSSLPADYLEYPLRRHGMDHDRYDWTQLHQRRGVAWPGGARIALWITVALEWFPLDMKGQPFKPPGAMQTAYPDLRHYTLRDYGNRVGIYRVMQALQRHGIRASAAVNTTPLPSRSAGLGGTPPGPSTATVTLAGSPAAPGRNRPIAALAAVGALLASNQKL